MGRARTHSEGSPAGGRILIVDDQEDVRLMLQTVLSLEGWDTEEAASGEEAVARVGRTPDLDVLVVDYKMPDLDGMEVARRIRRSGFERPIIICSAYLNPQIESEASALGAHTVSKADLRDLKETIRERARAPGPEQRLKDSHLAAIVESAEEAIMACTLAGTVEGWNPAAERLYGYSAQEIIGRAQVSLLVPADHHNDVPEILQRIGQGERVEDYKTLRETKDGRLIHVSLTSSPIRDRKGEIVGAVTITRDLAENMGTEEKFRALLDSAPDAMVIVGIDGLMTLVNRQTELLFGYRREELLAQPVEMLVPERFRDRHPGRREGYFADPKVRPAGAGLQLYAVRSDGREFPVEISLSPLKTAGATTVSAAIRDVTERKRGEELQRALATEQEAAQHLRDLNRLKDEFLATVSHELRTPLTVIAALAEVLGKSPDREDRAKLLERIFQNASDMGAMIEQLLDYSRLEAGKAALDVGPLPLRDAVVRCIDLAPDMGGREVALEVPGGLTVQVDALGFERILVNLLANAAKFSPEASPIRVTATAENGEATIAVEDEGIGIPTEEQERIFDRFHRVAVVSGKRGTGIGLSIVRRYVEWFGGEVRVESTPGHGAKFLFTLPLSAELERSAR